LAQDSLSLDHALLQSIQLLFLDPFILISYRMMLAWTVATLIVHSSEALLNENQKGASPVVRRGGAKSPHASVQSEEDWKTDLIKADPLQIVHLNDCGSNESLDCVDYKDIAHDFDASAVSIALRSIAAQAAAAAKSSSGATMARPMVWIHIHKNAGSTVCALAKANGERIISPHHNCNWDEHDNSWITGKGVHTSCATRQKTFAEQGATWGQIEREVHLDDFCEGFRYGIMLRDPVEHAVSLSLFHDFQPTHINDLIACIRSSSCNSKQFHVYDNFMIRRMLGEAGLAIQPRKVTEEHARQVIRLLEQKFEVVALLDNFGDTLTTKLEWIRVDFHKRNNKHLDELRTRFDDEGLQFIRENTKMDRMVYEHFGGGPGQLGLHS
jgi:hypothetical protein